MGVKTDIAQDARRLAQSDIGSAAWSEKLRSQTLEASESDMGFLVVAQAVLLSARQERLAELKDSYRQAARVLTNGDYRRAQQLFEALGDYSDSKYKAGQAAAKEQQRIKEEEEQRRKNEAQYKWAQECLSEKKYDRAKRLFAELGSYRDSSRLASDLQSKELRYASAVSEYEAGNYAKAEQAFRGLFDYKESQAYAETAKKERLRESELERAAQLQETIVELRIESEIYTEYKSQLLEAQRLSSAKPSRLHMTAKDTSVIWGGLIAVSLWAFSSGNVGPVEQYPGNFWLLCLCLGLAGFAALIIGYRIDQQRSKDRSRGDSIMKSLPCYFDYHEAVSRSVPWGRGGSSGIRITVEEVDNYLDVLSKEIEHLTKDISTIRQTYSNTAAAPSSLTAQKAGKNSPQ